MDNKELITCLFDSIPEYSRQKYIAFLKCDSQKNDILSQNPHMLMIMWLMSQQIKAEKASLIPFYIEERLGSCNMKFLASLDVSQIQHAMTFPTKLHRFGKMAIWLHEMAKLITEKYAGEPANIWKNASSGEISGRCREIKGFGRKLSAMVPINLIRNFNLPLTDKEEMNIALDTHVRCVLKRTGLSRFEATDDEMLSDVRSAAKSRGRCAMELDLPLWATGNFYCRKESRNCRQCPLSNPCPKLPFH